MGRKFRKNMVGYIKFPPSWGKITTITKSFSISVLHKKSKAASFSAPVRPPLGTIGESIAAIRRFHSLRSFHQRLLKVGPLRGPEVICETRVLYKASAPSGRRAKCDDTQGDALGYELLPLQGVWGNRNYINCCIWLSVNPVISITDAASMPFDSIFLAISILLWLLPFSMPC